MELYKIITANMVLENLSWDRVVDVILSSEDGNPWMAHYALEDVAEYTFQGQHGDFMRLERM